MSVSVEDIGRQAGVGRATAYRVLTNHPHVSAGTRAKVLQAVEQLGYPRMRPRQKRRGGFVLWGPLPRGVEPDPFFYEIYAALEAVMSRRRRVIRSVSCPLPDSPEELPLELLRENLEGIITVSLYSRRHLEVLTRRWPVVSMLYTRHIPGAITLGADFADAGRRAVEHLLARGHRRIALVTGAVQERNFSRQVLEGCTAALARAGVRFDRALVHSDRGNLGRLKPDKSRPLAVDAGRALLGRRERPTAIIARQDSMPGVLAAAGELGLRVPGDLSLLGIGTPNLAGAVSPRLTSICFSPEDMVELGLKMLKAVPPEGARIMMPVELVEGQSVRDV